MKVSHQDDGNEQVPINVTEESTENIPDGFDDQLEEISPPTPKIRPIIAPDMFPPFVEYCNSNILDFIFRLDHWLSVKIRKIILNLIEVIRRRKN